MKGSCPVAETSCPVRYSHAQALSGQGQLRTGPHANGHVPEYEEFQMAATNYTKREVLPSAGPGG